MIRRISKQTQNKSNRKSHIQIAGFVAIAPIAALIAGLFLGSTPVNGATISVWMTFTLAALGILLNEISRHPQWTLRRRGTWYVVLSLFGVAYLLRALEVAGNTNQATTSVSAGTATFLTTVPVLLAAIAFYFRFPTETVANEHEPVQSNVESTADGTR